MRFAWLGRFARLMRFVRLGIGDGKARLLVAGDGGFVPFDGDFVHRIDHGVSALIEHGELLEASRPSVLGIQNQRLIRGLTIAD